MGYLIKVIFVYSTFGAPLGNPIYMLDEYPNMEICEEFRGRFMSGFPQKISLEYSAVADSKCMTQQEFMEYVQRMQGPPRPPTPDE